ncbi:MAG: alpha/beta hydrolase [Patescibacteria group bacterium]
MKKQIVIIHGGNVLNKKDDFLAYLKKRKVVKEDFKTKKSWKDNFETKMESKFEIFAPKMPNKENAKYTEWKIWFEKLVPFLKNDVTLIGHSLGGLFLVKYLSESLFPKKIKMLVIVSAPYIGEGNKYNIGKDYAFNDNFKKITGQAKKIYLFHSTDDKVVPFSDFEIYKANLPNASFNTFKNKGHFSVDKFPELIKVVKILYS